MALISQRFGNNARLQKAAQNMPPLKIGERGDAVEIVQMALLDLGIPMPVSTSGGRKLPDGIFGPETAKAVRQFQLANGLSPDSIVGRQTLGRLEKLIVAQSEALAIADVVRARSTLS